MTTTFDDAPDHTPGADEAATGEERPRVRRFAPRRSRSAGAPAGVTPTHAPAEPVSTQEPEELVAADTAQAPLTFADDAPPIADEPASQVEAAPIAPARTRRSRSRLAVAAEAAPPETEQPPATLAEAVPDEQPVIEAPEPIIPVVEAAPAPRTARTRSRRRPAAAAAETEASKAQPPAQAEATPAAAGSVAPEVTTEPEAEAPARAARPRRTRRRKADAAPFIDEQEQPAAGAAELVASAPVDTTDTRTEPLTTWFPDGEMIQTAPGGDLEGTEALARALLEMFPPVAHEEANGTATDEAQVADLQADDVLAEAQAILESEDDEEDAEDGTPRRRSRRGRRGGRGRRRGGLTAVPSAEIHAPETAQPEDNDHLAATAPEGAAAMAPDSAPAASGSAASAFVPENPPRADRPWRERGPRRLWGRTYGRELSPPVSMPPPKPSNGARFAPIPQAAPPLSAVAQPEPPLPAPPIFVMPDLRIDEPLAPGETRTERLLDVQTRLMQAMLEQQARQIEVLTGSVNSLRQTVQNLSAGGAALRTYQPRTGIFVDAPNVCYAAENSRVNLDFARMLKYLSHDRYLVHAFAYSPIIDDVREGIRYETQRFVAPFLRSGYKLVTKPLKRFSDGSAKGNFDIEMAVDIVTMSDRLDLVVLVSGDSDFERMIELIQSRGVRVEVVAFASNVSTELVNIADVFIDINQHLEHMRAL